MKLEEDLNALRSSILDKIRPTKNENHKISAIVAQITKILEQWNQNNSQFSYEFVTPQGSTGIKQTHLRNDSDIDLFIFLNPENYRDAIDPNAKTRIKISTLFRRLCDEWIIPALKESQFEDIYIAYAENPYVSTFLKGYDIDIVFSFILPEEQIQKYGPITAVDRTYYHSKFVTENLTPEQIDDVRIMKMFFKQNYSYGDKSPIARGGFIGYAAELLIYHFGDIWSLFRNFKELPFTAVDFFKRSTSDLRAIPRVQKDFLLVMDPTDRKRNVAASISERAWIYCLKRIENFLATPELRNIYDENKHVLEKDDKYLNNHFVVVETIQVSDSHYTKIRDKLYSIAESIKNLASYEFDHSPRFSSVEYSIYFNPSNKRFSLAFYTEQSIIDLDYMRKGPRVDKSKNFEKFKAKHSDMIIKNGYSYVKEIRKFTNFQEIIISAFNDRIFNEVKLTNISSPKLCHYEESLSAVYVLKNCVLPYRDELEQIVRKVIPKKLHKKR